MQIKPTKMNVSVASPFFNRGTSKHSYGSYLREGTHNTAVRVEGYADFLYIFYIFIQIVANLTNYWETLAANTQAVEEWDYYVYNLQRCVDKKIQTMND